MQRIYQQLIQFPNHTKWQLNIGNHWNIVRHGYTLRITLVASIHPCVCQESVSDHPSLWLDDGTIWRTVPNPGTGTMLNNNHDSATWEDWLHIRIPEELLKSPFQFIQSTVGEYNRRSDQLLYYTPPWRRNVNRPIRINDFLRGQKIPLHLRESTPIILLLQPQKQSNEDSTTAESVSLSTPSQIEPQVLVPTPTPSLPVLVAIYISTKHRWMMDDQFFIPNHSNDAHDHSNNNSDGDINNSSIRTSHQLYSVLTHATKLSAPETGCEYNE
jgi:hypothetical protein